MNPRPHVLAVSRDEMLSRTRKMILGTFFDAQCAARLSEAQALINADHFDLIVLCNSLRNDESEFLAALAHSRFPRPLVLATVDPSDQEAKPWADTTLQSNAGPYALLKKCAEMLSFRLRGNSKSIHI